MMENLLQEMRENYDIKYKDDLLSKTYDESNIHELKDELTKLLQDEKINKELISNLTRKLKHIKHIR